MLFHVLVRVSLVQILASVEKELAELLLQAVTQPPATTSHQSGTFDSIWRAVPRANTWTLVSGGPAPEEEAVLQFLPCLLALIHLLNWAGPELIRVVLASSFCGVLIIRTTAEKRKLCWIKIFRVHLWNYVPWGREWLLCVVSVVLVTWLHPGKYRVYLSTLDAPHCSMSYMGLFSFPASLEG